MHPTQGSWRAQHSELRVAPEMPNKTETAEQKSLRLSQQSHKLRVKSDFVKVCAIIKNREDLIARFKHELIQLGELVVDSSGSAPPGAFVAKVESSPSVKKEAGETNAATAEGAGVAEPSPSESDMKSGTPTLHRNYQTWSTVSPKHILTLLSAAGPVALNIGNMRPVIKRGCKVPPKAILMECLEFVADLDPSSTIPDRDLEGLTALVCGINRKNGRMARDLQFPVSWPDVGHFALSAKPPCLQVTCRSNNKLIIIPGVATEEGVTMKYSIDSNYSRHRASLMLPGQRSINLAAEFAKQGVGIESDCDGRSTFDGTTLSCGGAPTSATEQTPPPKRPRVRSPSPQRMPADERAIKEEQQTTALAEAPAAQLQAKEEPDVRPPPELKTENTESPASGQLLRSSRIASRVSARRRRR